MVATGINVENGVVPNTDGKGGSKLPPPSAQDLWIAEHPLPMQSSYATLLGAEPEFTTCHSKFIGTVDYIWFTPEVIYSPYVRLSQSLLHLSQNFGKGKAGRVEVYQA